MKHYTFILGREYLLSLAEIIQVFKAENIEFELIVFNNQFAVFKCDELGQTIFSRLGGSKKYGEVEPVDTKEVEAKIEDLVRSVRIKKKLNFGISEYGDASRKEKDIKALGLAIKNRLKEEGINSRFVTSKMAQLSSVVVKKNALASDRGIEVLVCKDKGKAWVGKTLAVQDFESFSARDYDRPARDDVSGMLPPKLARMMINLAGLSVDKDKVVLDPFCGSGTVLQEAAILGAGKILGSDYSNNAVQGSLANIFWLKEGRELSAEFIVEQVDVRELSSWVPAQTIDLIVTEPFLGDPVRGKISGSQIKKRQAELSELYSAALEQFDQALKPDGRVVIIFPFLDQDRLPLPKKLAKLFTIVPVLEGVADTNRGGIDYKRPGQKLGREIFVLRKK